MNRRASVFAVLALVACNENGLNNLPGDEGVGGQIEVSPPLIQYGTLQQGETDTRPFLITNVGNATLLVEELVPGGSSSFTLIDPPSNFMLPVGASETINVQFTPMQSNDQFGHVLVLSEDPDDPEERVELAGQGAVPELEIDPPSWDFSADFVGCGDEVDLTLTNVGTDDLVITDLDYVDPDGQLSLVSALSLPLVLSPGSSTGVVVEWNPTFEVTAEGRLDVTSNDPRGVVSATQEAEGIFATIANDEFTVPVDPPVDIIFAVDQSCSMDAHASQLTTAFSGLITQMSQVTNGWRVGVATLDTGCFNSGFFTSSTPNLTSTFASAVTVGDELSVTNTEKLFALTLAALQKTASGQCNAGFLRASALLHVIFVSDEYEQGTMTPATFVSSASSYKSTPALFKSSGILCNPTCSNLDGSNARYIDAVNLTGGIHLDVMSTYWSSYAQQLAAASLISLNTYELSQNAAGDSIRVWVDGTEWTTGWHYDPSTNEIIFDAAPPQGANIEVEYGVLVPC